MAKENRLDDLYNEKPLEEWMAGLRTICEQMESIRITLRSRRLPRDREHFNETFDVVREGFWAAINIIAIGGADAVPALIEVLKNGTFSLRRAAINILLRIGPAAADAVPVLVQAMKRNEDPSVEGAEAAEALGRIGSQAAIAALIATVRKRRCFFLSTSHVAVGAAAAQALGAQGCKGQCAIPVLKEAMSDPNDGVRKAAAEALKAIKAGLEATASRHDADRPSQTVKKSGRAICGTLPEGRQTG